MDRGMYRVIKKFLTEEEILYLKRVSLSCLDNSTFIPVDSMSKIHLKVLTQAQEFTKIKPLIGVEQWSFHADYTELPDWHQDRDEELFNKTEKLSFPACSCVLYLDINKLKGGSLELKDKVIVPETGMLVLLKPAVWHKVSQYTSGKRHSINYNFWDKPLYSS